VVLSAELGRGGDVPSALRAYDRDRRPRDERLAAASDRLAKITQVRHPVALALRNLAVRLTPPEVAVRSIARTTAWQPPAAR
jgi:2-polyprenyl-6-methoxyphenol hydroxylase-like FAD-dependent oxidoreductase